MSIFHHAIDVGDPEGSRFEGVDTLVDTGATFTVVPAAVLQRLGVVSEEKVQLELANGRLIERDMGETKVRLGGKTLVTAVVFGDADTLALLGVYTRKRLCWPSIPFARGLFRRTLYCWG